MIMGRLERAIKTLRNLPKEAVATRRRTAQMGADDLRNRAMKSIDIIKKHKGNKRRVDKYMQEAWQIYQRLQNLVGTEFFVDNYNKNPDRTITLQPYMYSGGLGYRHVNWDAEFLMAMPKGYEKYNPFWQPTSGKRDENGVLLDLMDSDYWVFNEKTKQGSSL